MKNYNYIVLLLLIALFSCESEDDIHKKMVNNLEGQYMNTEISIYYPEQNCVYTCDWELYTVLKDDPENNFSINQIGSDKIEINFGDGAVLHAENFVEAKNGIFGEILLQNQTFDGEIVTIEGYYKWEIEGNDDYYSISYNNNIIDFYFIVDDIVLFHFQATKD